MIRKLTDDDRQALLAFLGQAPALNLFLIGDVENFGFQQDFQEIWGEFVSADGRLKAVLLRYEHNYLPYADGPFDVNGFAELMLRDDRLEMLSGSSDLVAQFRELMSFRKEKKLFFAELTSLNEAGDRSPHVGASVRRAEIADVEPVCSLMDVIEEFDTNPDSMRSGMRRSLETGTGRTYLIERDGHVAAAASTAAENSLSAMVIGVATHPDYRGQGLATSVVRKLCADVVQEGRSLCLFYDNPKAGTIYKRIGFQDIGFWTMMYK